MNHTIESQFKFYINKFGKEQLEKELIKIIGKNNLISFHEMYEEVSLNNLIEWFGEKEMQEYISFLFDDRINFNDI